jgi:hypothetical protein
MKYDSARKLLSNTVVAKLVPGKYILWVDRSTVDVDKLAAVELPEGIDMTIIPLSLEAGQSITDAIFLLPAERVAEFMATKPKEKPIV